MIFIATCILSTYYYTYSEVYDCARSDYGPTKIIKDTEVFISIQMTKEGHRETFFGNEYRSPYKISFVFKGVKGIHEEVEITYITVSDSMENQFSLVKEANTLKKHFTLWPNKTWGANFGTSETFSLDFSNNPILIVNAKVAITLKGEKYNFEMSEKFNSNIRETSGFSAINIILAMLGLI